MAEQNKLVKTVTDSAVLFGLRAGVGYLAKKMLKENFLGGPSSSIMNYAKFTAVLAGSINGFENLSRRSKNNFKIYLKYGNYGSDVRRRDF